MLRKPNNHFAKIDCAPVCKLRNKLMRQHIICDRTSNLNINIYFIYIK
jgi:hypothetical protein